MSDALQVCLPPLVGGMMALSGGFHGPYWPMVVLTLTESFVLAWYRRFPLAVLVVVTGLEFTLAALDIPVFVGILVAATGLGAWGRPRQQRIGVAFVLGTLLTAAVLSPFLKHGEPLVVALVFVIVAILIVGFVAIGRAGARQRLRIQELREHSRRLEASRELAEQRAAERERALLARELHDILNHAVTAMVLDAEVAADTGKDTEVTLRRVASTGRESLAELRRLLGVLRDPPDGHDPLAVPPRLDQLAELVAGARGRLERKGEERPVDASIELAVYRVVQESLTNVAKHAGEVEAEVVLSYTPDALEVRIVNPAADTVLGTDRLADRRFASHEHSDGRGELARSGSGEGARSSWGSVGGGSGASSRGGRSSCGSVSDASGGGGGEGARSSWGSAAGGSGAGSRGGRSSWGSEGGESSGGDGRGSGNGGSGRSNAGTGGGSGLSRRGGGGSGASSRGGRSSWGSEGGESSAGGSDGGGRGSSGGRGSGGGSRGGGGSSGSSSGGGGFGLIGMRERVELLGGQLRAGPRPDGGFEVFARLPLRSTP